MCLHQALVLRQRYISMNMTRDLTHPDIIRKIGVNNCPDIIFWYFVESFIFMLSKGQGVGSRILEKKLFFISIIGLFEICILQLFSVTVMFDY